MKFTEIKARRAAPQVVQPEPINQAFISITELLARLQTAPAVTLTDAAEWLLVNWCNAKNPPIWKVRGKHGIVPIDAFSEKHEIPLKRLEYVFHRGHFESDGPDSGASLDYDFFGFDRKEFTDFLTVHGEPLDLFGPVPDTAPAQPTPPAPVVAASGNPAPDFSMLATREQLIKAFGRFTGMDASWFKNLRDTPALLAARKVTGQGGRGHITEPWFCPFEVMQWLVDRKRRKGSLLGAEKAWGLLEKNFLKVHTAHSVGDPRTDD